jgi:ribonuclease HII
MQHFDRTLIPPSPNLSFELPLWQEGCLVAGLDEAGRGAWAGPVAAAAVILPRDPDVLAKLNGVRDSKELSPLERARLAEIVRCAATAWGVGLASQEEIDECGILAATRLAMARALQGLGAAPQVLLLDALFLPEEPLPQIALIKGDQRSLSIAAASILAKTTRDAWMINAAREFPAYGFEQHKGYGTKLHQGALAAHGPCTLHRKTFAPIRLLRQTKTQE